MMAHREETATLGKEMKANHQSIETKIDKMNEQMIAMSIQIQEIQQNTKANQQNIGNVEKG